MVHLWSGNRDKYLYSEFVTFCEAHPWLLKFYTLMLGDLKIYDRTFRLREKWLIMRIRRRYRYVLIIWEIIKYIPYYFQELYWLFFKCIPILWERRRETRPERRRAQRARFLDYFAEFEDCYFTWDNYWLCLIEWTRVWVRLCVYLMVTHLILTTPIVVQTIHQYFYLTTFNYYHIMFWLPMFYWTHAVYRFYISEHLYLRPYTLEVKTFKYQCNRLFSYFKRGVNFFWEKRHYFMNLNKKWRQEDINLDFKVKSFWEKFKQKFKRK